MSRRAIIIVALALPTVVTWAYFSGEQPAVKLVYAFGKTVQFSLPLAWWACADSSGLVLPRPTKRGWWAAVLFGLLVGLGIVTLYASWLKHHAAFWPLGEQLRGKVAAFGIDTPARFLGFALFLSLLHALLEEYYWRAFLFVELRRHMHLTAAIALSSLGFMAHHVIVLACYFPGRFWSFALPFALAVAVGGATWAWLYERCRSIYPVWVSHALVDAALMLVGADVLFDLW